MGEVRSAGRELRGDGCDRNDDENREIRPRADKPRRRLQSIQAVEQRASTLAALDVRIRRGIKLRLLNVIAFAQLGNLLTIRLNSRDRLAVDLVERRQPQLMLLLRDFHIL